MQDAFVSSLSIDHLHRPVGITFAGDGMFGATFSMRARSALVRFTSSAPMFSCKYLRRFVPGIGAMSSPRASTLASASCAGVHCFSRAISPVRFRRVRVFVVSYVYDSVVSFSAVAKSSGNGASKFLHSPLRGWRNPIFQACNICRGKSFARRTA
jgi:hypothetical protein